MNRNTYKKINEFVDILVHLRRGVNERNSLAQSRLENEKKEKEKMEKEKKNKWKIADATNSETYTYILYR